MIECRTCLIAKPYGVGWSGRRCPECQAVAAARQYKAVKANPQRLRARKSKQESARRRRQLNAAQNALRSRASGGQAGIVDASLSMTGKEPPEESPKERLTTF